LIRAKDGLLAQLRELSKQKPRGKTDENLIADIARIEGAIAIAKDDLVRVLNYLGLHPLIYFPSECLQTPIDGYPRRTEAHGEGAQEKCT
jgi:hypothetical protein